MGRRNLMDQLNLGDIIPSARETAYKLPSIAAAAAAITGSFEGAKGIRVRHVVGATNKTIIEFNAALVTLADAAQGLALQLLDFPEGLITIISAEGTLTFTTTSVLADTLNLSKTIKWAVGTKAGFFTAGSILTRERNILGPVTATSSATINVANTATSGVRDTPVKLRGHSTAPDVYLNITIPTAGDIDAEATVALNGSITIYHRNSGDIASANDSRMWSAAIWDECPWDDIKAGRLDGVAHFTDFTGAFAQATNLAARAAGGIVDEGWVAFTGNDAGNTITMPTDEPYGVVKLLLTGDNLSTAMAWGGVAAAGQLVVEAGKQIWFEARVKFETITDDRGGFAIGLGEEGLCVTIGLVNGSDDITDKDFIGFHRDAADGDALDVKVNTAGGGGITTVKADASAIAATTYYKLGIYGDGTTLYFYVDGVQVASVAYSATNVPDGEELNVYLFGTNKGSTGNYMMADWVRVANLRA